MALLSFVIVRSEFQKHLEIDQCYFTIAVKISGRIKIVIVSCATKLIAEGLLVFFVECAIIIQISAGLWWCIYDRLIIAQRILNRLFDNIKIAFILTNVIRRSDC